MKKRTYAIASLLVLGATVLIAQPHLRRHLANSIKPVRLVPATQEARFESNVEIEEDTPHRHIHANGIPNHKVGRFPNRGNPHSIQEQQHHFKLPIHPKQEKDITPLHQAGRFGPPNLPFGIAINGVLFDPGTAEYWNGDRRADWNYEALGGAVPLGIDESHAHVQPTGSYHYHGLPTLLLKQLGYSDKKHSPMIGWAADGFPVYAQYGFQDPNDSKSKIIELRSSYQLKEGERPGGRQGPGGTYDGTFVQDYQFVEGAGDLDACNGRQCVTPDFPDGTYAYFLTSDWPVIPRAFRGKPFNLRFESPRRR